jgi:hypothetical protein
VINSASDLSGLRNAVVVLAVDRSARLFRDAGLPDAIAEEPAPIARAATAASALLDASSGDPLTAANRVLGAFLESVENEYDRGCVSELGEWLERHVFDPAEKMRWYLWGHALLAALADLESQQRLPKPPSRVWQTLSEAGVAELSPEASRDIERRADAARLVPLSDAEHRLAALEVPQLGDAVELDVIETLENIAHSERAFKIITKAMQRLDEVDRRALVEWAGTVLTSRGLGTLASRTELAPTVGYEA